jgi:hypothetical protein
VNPRGVDPDDIDTERPIDPGPARLGPRASEDEEAQVVR